MVTKNNKHQDIPDEDEDEAKLERLKRDISQRNVRLQQLCMSEDKDEQLDQALDSAYRNLMF